MYWVLLCLTSGTDLQKSRHVLKSLSLCNKVLSYLISLCMIQGCSALVLTGINYQCIALSCWVHSSQVFCEWQWIVSFYCSAVVQPVAGLLQWGFLVWIGFVWRFEIAVCCLCCVFDIGRGRSHSRCPVSSARTVREGCGRRFSRCVLYRNKAVVLNTTVTRP